MLIDTLLDFRRVLTLADYRAPYSDRYRLPKEHERRADAQSRLKIDREDFRELVEARIDEVYELSAIRRKVKRFVTTAINPLQMIADRIAVAYRVPPTRSLVGDATASDVFSRLMRETKIATRAKQWGRYAFITNVCHVIPWPVMSESGGDVSIRYVTVTADVSDVGIGSNPESPDVIWYDIPEGLPDLPQARTVFLDSDAWHYLDGHGELLRSFQHGLGIAPFSTFRVRPMPHGDYWDRHRGRRLVDATLDVGRLVAAMGYVRKDQNKKLMALFSDRLDDAVPNEQALQPEHPIVASAAPADVSFQVHDLTTSTSAFTDEINFHLEALSDSFGVPLFVLDPSAGNLAGTEMERSARAFSALSELRDQQVEMLRESEADLAYKTALIAQQFGHPLAVDPELVRETYEVRFAPLTFITHPRERMAYYTEAIGLGLLDQAAAYQHEHPELTVEEAEARVMEHAERRARINDFQASRNMPTDPSRDGDTLAALQGAQGGRPTGSGNDDAQEGAPGGPNQ